MMNVERKFIECFRGDHREKLQRCFENLDKVDLYPPDPMHDIRHQTQVERVAIWLADEACLDEGQKDYIRKATPLHDLGYSFVEMGILRPEEHSLGSGLIALYKTGDVQLARGIVQHSYNVLPVGITPWVLFLREADRADRWGWQGLISVAYYLGFRHELVSGNVVYQKNIRGELEVCDPIRDIRHPDTVNYRFRPILDGSYPVRARWTWTDYEENAANFVRKEIFPYLQKNGLLSKAVRQFGYADEWIEGVESNDSTWDNPKWKVDSVMCEGSYDFFSAKRFNTEQAEYELGSYESCYKEGRQKFNDWLELNSQTVSGDKQELSPLHLTLKHIQPGQASKSRLREYNRECERSYTIPYLGHELHFADNEPYVNP